MNSPFLRALRGQLLREIFTLLLFAGLMLQSATAVAPDWWTTQAALLPDADSDDYAVANVGQLKNIALKAATEMNSLLLPDGAGAIITGMLDEWNAAPLPGVVRDDYVALTVGQLKKVAKPFYDRLAAVGVHPANTYPWTGAAANDYALANLGQVKAVFAFAVPPLAQLAAQTRIPAAQLLAAWQAWQSVPMEQRAENSTVNDFDGDGISNLQEYLQSVADPTHYPMSNAMFDSADIDGDHIPNTVEDLYPDIMSKSRFADAVEDYDGDGVMNYEEIQLGLSLSAADSARSDGLTDVQVLSAHLKATLPGTVREVTLRWDWDTSIYYLANYNYDNGLLTGHPEWMDQADSNANGLPDGWEQYLADYVPEVTRLSNYDCDGDHMPDVWEYRYQLDIRDPWDAGMEINYLVDVPQAPILPLEADYPVPADYDAAMAVYHSDLNTYNQLHAFMLQEDPDEDRLCNLREYYLGSNPRMPDTDGDGITDTAALAANLDPSGGGTNRGSGAMADDDGDGIPNLWELQHNLDPQQSGAGVDSDHDGYTNYEEYTAGSDVFSNASRPGPALEVREKNYGSTFTHYTMYNNEVQTLFNGGAGLYGGKTYLYVSGFDGSFPITDSEDRSAEMRAAFEEGDYEGTLVGWPYLFQGDTYVWTDVYYVGDREGPNWYKSSGGTAMELRITDPTISNAPAVDWSRTYLVVEYSGAVADYSTFNDLPLTTVVGTLTFNRDVQGHKSIDFQGDTSKVKVSGDRVEVIPTEEEGYAVKIALLSVDFVAPEAPDDSGNPAAPAHVDTPLAAGDNPPPPTGSPFSDSNIEFANSQFAKADKLKVAKLTDCIRIGGILDTKSEPDQFMLRISKCSKYDGDFSFNLSSIDQNGFGRSDNSTEIPMKFDGVGNYYSPRLLLVAHLEDDAYPAGVNVSSPTLDQLFGRDDVDQSNPDFTNPSDRTHLAAVDNLIKINSINFKPADTAKPKQTHSTNITQEVTAWRTVLVAIYAFRDSGAVTGNVVDPRVLNDLQRARDLFAQVGVRIQLAPGFPKIAEFPAGLGPNANSIVDAHASNSVGIPSTKGKSLLDACVTDENVDVCITYCASLRDQGDTFYNGYAYPASQGGGIYSNHAFIASTARTESVLVLGHELGHLITNSGHFGTDYPKNKPSQISIDNNLMKQGTPSGLPGIGSACRLQLSQEKLIKDYFLP